MYPWYTDYNMDIELYAVGGRENWRNATETVVPRRMHAPILWLYNCRHHLNNHPRSSTPPALLPSSCPPGQPANRAVQVFYLCENSESFLGSRDNAVDSVIVIDMKTQCMGSLDAFCEDEPCRLGEKCADNGQRTRGFNTPR